MMTEKRHHPRVYFTLDEAVTITVRPEEEDATGIVPAIMLSIGVGGIGFGFIRGRLGGLEIGKYLSIQADGSIPGYLPGLPPLRAKVRYIQDLEQFVWVAAGCQFIDLEDKEIGKIERLVKERRRLLAMD